MKNQNLSFEEVSKATKIPLKKFEMIGDHAFNATELCVICEYLHVKPEQFYERKLGDR